MVDFKKVLKGANKNWNKAKTRAAESSTFQEYEDGKYTARLVSAKLGVADSGRNQIAFGWKFEDGEYEGKTKTAYQGIDTEDNLYYLARDLERLGYELPDNLSDLPEILKDIEKTKPTASITLKTKGDSDFQNVYIRKVFGEEGEEDDTEDDGSDDAAEEETDEESEGGEEEAGDEEDAGDEEEGEEEEAGDDDEEEGEEEEEADEESDDEDTEEVDLVEGMRVIAETAKGREKGEVIEVLEKEEKVRVKLDNGKTVRVGLDKLEMIPDEPKKPAKKAAPAAPAKKPVKKSPPPPPAKKSGLKKKAKK